MISARMLIISVLTALPAAVCGCTGGPQKVTATPPAPVERVDAVNLLWDGQTAPDGVTLLVLLFREDGALPVMVRGALEVQLYEAQVGMTDLDKVKPAHAWRFEGTQLRARRRRTVYGWAYAVHLGWAAAPPKTSSVTLVVRYVPPSGGPVYAKPLSIPLSPR